MRVYRQISVMVVLYAILLLFVSKMSENIKLLVLIFSPFIPYLMIYLMHLVSNPIENFVKSLYKKDAENILSKHTDLIKIGITGSYGKTSTKNIVLEVLSEEFYALATPASFNTPMGITITIREQLKISIKHLLSRWVLIKLAI